MNITLQDIKKAHALIKDAVVCTPLRSMEYFSQLLGNSIYFKMENMQKTGSFKYRGCRTKLLRLSDDERKRGVVVASSGNHAQGVAANARELGIKATIVMPEGTPLVKVTATREYGAEVVLFGESFDDAYAHAEEIKKDKGITFIHPYEDPDIIAGHGSIGIELLEQNPDLDVVVIPIGGGGVISGTAIALKSLKPSIQIIGVQAENAPSMYLSFQKGEVQDTKKHSTIAEGIAVKKPSAVMLDLIKRNVDDVVTVTEDEIANAILLLIEKGKTVVEGAGSVPLAAILHNRVSFKNKNIGLVLTGGNIDVTMISRIIERGLAKSGRLVRFVTYISDKPGGLLKLTKILAGHRASIMQVIHDRTSLEMGIGETKVDITLETRGRDHIDMIISDLRAQGYQLRLRE